MTSKNKACNGASENGERSLTQMAYRKIEEMILHYEIIPGQRLVFVDLAKKIGVSRTPVNNALSMLANEGFLDFVPNQGYMVHELTREEADDLSYVREIIELGAIKLAIQKLTPEKLEILRRKKEVLSKKLKEGHLTRVNFVLDLEFHTCYIEMAGNPYLTDYFREIYKRIFLRHRLEGLSIARNKRVDLEHEELFRAISRRDIRKTNGLIRKHIWAAEEYIFSAFR